MYGSQNLRQEELLSEFGNASVADKDIQWECPDLLELPIQNQPNKKRWVLIVNINPGGAALTKRNFILSEKALPVAAGEALEIRGEFLVAASFAAIIRL